MRLILAFILFFTFLSISSFSQGQKPYGEFSKRETRKTENKLLKSARKEFDFGNYDQASAKYLELLKIDSTNPMYNFEQAQTLFNNYYQPQSIRYYVNAIKYSRDSLGEAYYFLANAYHLDGQFDNAQKNYRHYLNILSYHGTDLMEEEEADLKDEINHKIEMCGNGKALFQAGVADKFVINGKARTFRIENAGKEVNSDYDDYGAVLSANDSVMYFTSRREGTTGGKVDWDDKYFEDIYMSGLGKKGWGTSFPMGVPINTKKHEAIISIAADGKTIYFYRGVKQGTFYFTRLQGNVWTNPEILSGKSDMNTSAWETSFFGFAIAGSELYVVSDREGGLGGRDIYISKKQGDDSWGPLQNMGAPINTKYDEDAPFITADGKAMYFSSKGHNSMGGFDIFRSERDANKWSQPVNIGRPFNTPGEDIYFILANKSDRAYYSSSSLAADGTKDIDIYMIDLCDDAEDILLAGTTKGITSGSFSVIDKESGQNTGMGDFENGKFSVRLKHGKNYRFTFNVRAGSEPVSADISLPRQCKVHDVYQELDLADNTLLVKNAFFDIKKDAGNADYSEYLSKLDRASTPLYSEFALPVSAAVITVSTSTSTVASSTSATASSTTGGTAGMSTAAVSSATVTAGTSAVTASTPTVVVSTHAVTASTHTLAVSTPAVVASVSTPETISVGPISFDYDKSTIGGDISELDKVAAFMKRNKNVKIEIAGFTDSKGTDEYNLALSGRRANAVAAYLASKGISRGRMATVGHGESRPIAANENPDGSDNPEGRAKNRRTEITVVQ